MIHPNSKIEPFDLVIFGATGDLCLNKILPALLYRDMDGQLPQMSRVICSSRSNISEENYKILVLKKFESLKISKNKDQINKFFERLQYICLNVDEPETNSINLIKHSLEIKSNSIRLFYLATAPKLFAKITKLISVSNLINSHSRLIIEKPMGNDLNSSKQINLLINKYFNENQIFRIDHYLGKETVQNLMAIRFANQLFESQWNNNFIDNVQISVSETIGVEGRGSYYDSNGAIKDMLQNHLLQLVCLVAMEPPSNFKPELIRDEKLKIIQSLKKQKINNDFILGQYTSGKINNLNVNSYKQDVNNPNSLTETFIALKLYIDNWRWAGIPFYIRTGKRLKKQNSEIVITFKSLPHFIFDKQVSGEIKTNQLIITLQPNEGLRVLLMTKEPGPGGLRLKPSFLNLSFSENYKKRIPNAYERLLMDVVRGNQTLFMSGNEVEAAWEWIDPIIKSIQELKLKPESYKSGSWGPNSAIKLIENDKRSWFQI